MPNHCETDFAITGPRILVELVLEKHFDKDGNLDCSSVIPYPQKFIDQDNAAKEWQEKYCNDWSLRPEFEGKDIPKRPTDGFNLGGYEWCISNWGTKWGTYDGRGIAITPLKAGNNCVKALMSFQSAWAPPTPVFYTLAAKYPQLTFRARSYEGGMGYRTNSKWEKGENVYAVEYAYKGSRGG
jgi:hypothetical protein